MPGVSREHAGSFVFEFSRVGLNSCFLECAGSSFVFTFRRWIELSHDSQAASPHLADCDGIERLHEFVVNGQRYIISDPAYDEPREVI